MRRPLGFGTCGRQNLGNRCVAPAHGQAQRAHALQQSHWVHSLTRLATAQRINRGADDPSGLIASEDDAKAAKDRVQKLTKKHEDEIDDGPR